MKTTVTLLGTGTSQGVPMVGCHCEVCSSLDFRDHRLRTSAMVEIDRGDKLVRIIIDAGPDFRYQMLRERVDSIDAILLTHEHKDHIGGIDDVRAFNYWMRRSAEIYCSRRVSEVVRKDYDYAFPDLKKHYPGVPQINLNLIESGVPFEVEGIEIQPLEVMHCRLPIQSFKIGDLCYITDANYINDRVLEQVQGCKLLVINALRREEHISHFTLNEALSVIERVKPQKAVLTHVSHQMGLYDRVKEELPEGVILGYDRLRLEI